MTVLALASCSDALGPDLDYVQVALSASGSEMVAGDTIEFRVVASNPTGRSLRFRTNACVLSVRLVDASGYPVFQDPFTCNDIGLLHELAPGEYIEEIIGFDGSSSWGPFLDESGREATFVLAPGTYRAIGGISAALLNPSNTVELRIRPKP